MMDSNEMGRVVRYHRKRAGLARVDLAALAGIGKTALYDIEHRKDTVQYRTLKAVLEALNISIRLESPLMDAWEQARKGKGDGDDD